MKTFRQPRWICCHHLSNGFTLSELLCVIAIIAILTTMGIPTVRKGIEFSQNSQCVSNLRQLGVATRLYANDNNDEIPYEINYGTYAHTWTDQIAPYAGLSVPANGILPAGVLPQGPLRCPSCSYLTRSGGTSHYGKNYYINSYSGTSPDLSPLRTNYRFSTITSPGQFIYLADVSSSAADGLYCGRSLAANASKNPKFSSKYGVEGRHQGRANALYFDFHIESLIPTNLPDLVYGQPPWCPRASN